MATVTIEIGRETIEVPTVQSFGQLERAWPAINAYDAASDVVERGAAAIGILASLIARARPELTPEELKERMSRRQVARLDGQVMEILKDSDVMEERAPGEAGPAEAPARSSTEISGA